MSMNNAILRVEKLGKRYQRGSYNFASLKLQTASWLANLLGRQDPNQPLFQDEATNPCFWALQDVSFSLNRGQALGVVGANGVGKSTLLKLLSRVTAPTQGRIILNGSTASLLEVGTGFHPELTGRENIFLSGALLGMSPARIRSVLDRIVEFSGVEAFIDTPVKRYSSGMVVRLGFSIALHLNAELLLLDEVLAVGDEAFSRKCLKALHEALEQERSILFVSHNLQAIETLCPQTLVLDRGRLSFSGNTSDALNHYRSLVDSPPSCPAEHP